MNSQSLSVLIIRHAEKMEDQWPGPGLTPEGKKDKKSLVVRGWQRAGAWACLFGADFGGSDYPKPTAIYAANPDRAREDKPTPRPLETVIPLAARLGLSVVTDYAVGQEMELSKVLTSQSGVALVAWEHRAITSKLLPAILGGQRIENVPTKWDDARYDLVLRFDRTSSDGSWSFRQLAPCVLFGDSPSPML